MTVKEFKKFLDQFPDEAEVQVLQGRRGRDWQGDSYGHVNFEGNNFKDYNLTDLRGNKLITEDKSYYNKIFLELGGED